MAFPAVTRRFCLQEKQHGKMQGGICKYTQRREELAPLAPGRRAKILQREIIWL